MSRRMLAEFTTADALTAAVREARALGPLAIETFTPFPIEELLDLCDPRPSKARTVMVVAGVLGGAIAFAMQYYSAVYAYPIDSGGRPLNSWPAFMLVVFEFVVLFAAVGGFFSLMIASGLPRLHHPRFDVEDFARASDDRFFVEVDLAGEADEGERLARLFERHGARRIREREA